MRTVLFIFCLVLSTLPGYGITKDTFEVHFPLNVSKISKEAEEYLDRLIFKDMLLHGDKLIVLGYADYLGGNSYNDTLSMLRAKNVRNYLIKSGFDENDIKLCIGKGKVDRTNLSGNDGYAPDRKVQIIIDRATMAEQAKESTEQKKDFDLSKLNVNQTVALENIFFKLNSPILLDKSQPDLVKLLDFLKHYPTVGVRIEGHVCCMGPQEGMDSRYKGENLSELRAKAIRRFLVDKGVDSLRLEAIGMGNRNPVVKNEVTEADKQKNRRVEVRILSK